MESLVFTQLSVPEIRLLFRSEIEGYFATCKPFGSRQPEADRHLTIKQAAVLLTLSVQTIYGLVSKKAICHYKVGKRLYFLESELNAWVQSGRKKTQIEIDADAETHLLNLKMGAL